MANINSAQLYYETAGKGTPFVMIHAGVADCRQWNNEFEYFLPNYRVIRYDQRGYGKSKPVVGEFSYMMDLSSLLDYLEIDEPLILMGCSMGGSLAMDFALAYPSRVKALIMVGSGPSGLELDVPELEKFAEAEKAFEAGDLDLATEIETQIWFDGMSRAPHQTNQIMRKLAFDMNRIALGYQTRQLGTRLPNSDSPAADRLSELNIPVLIIVGEYDVPYILRASDFMKHHIRSARTVLMEDAAHLPNMDHPEEFRRIVESFLDEAAV